MGLGPSLLVPVIAARYPKSHGLLIWLSIIMGVLGSLGLLLFPKAALPIWVTILGFGPIMFPLGMTLFNLRSRNRTTVLAISSFAQTISYSTASFNVFLTGVLRQVTGNWDAYFILLITMAGLAVFAGLQISKGKYIDDELDSHQVKSV
jgi:CP family cyanate transporter-like MFS transporter